MKSLCLTACLCAFLLPARADQNPAAQESPEAGQSALQRAAEETNPPLRDPFASESESAKTPGKIKDPLQPMNRAFFRFNDKLYIWVLKPAGKGYSKVLPGEARASFGRLFANVKYPIHLVNNLLQGKFKAAGIETGRFIVNSTVGIGGLFDPAKEWKIEAHPADFDQTLGFYGLGPGIYFHWPFFGPSSGRGTAGIAADGMLSPWAYIGGAGVFIAVPAYRELNNASLHLGEYEAFKKATVDPYVALRSAYYESRADAVQKSRVKEIMPGDSNRISKASSRTMAAGSQLNE